MSEFGLLDSLLVFPTLMQVQRWRHKASIRRAGKSEAVRLRCRMTELLKKKMSLLYKGQPVKLRS